MKLLISIPVYELDNAIEIIHNVLKYTNNSYFVPENIINPFNDDFTRKYSNIMMIKTAIYDKTISMTNTKTRSKQQQINEVIGFISLFRNKVIEL